MATQGTLFPPHSVVRGIVATFHTLAFITTLLRLFHRYQRRHLGWDDLWAGLSLILAIITFVLYLLRPVIFGHPTRPLPSKKIPVPVQNFVVLGPVVLYMFGLWASKLAMAASIVRLLGKGLFKRTAKYAVGCVALAGVALSTSRIFRCGTDFSRPAFCLTPRYIAYVELFFDMLSDTWLIGAPLYMLSRMRLASQDRRVIGAVFICGIFTTIASIVHNAFILAQEIRITGLTAHVQLAVSIVISNLLVLVTYVYRKTYLHMQDSTNANSTSDPSNSEPDNATPMSVLRLPDHNSGAPAVEASVQGYTNQQGIEIASFMNENKSASSTLDLGSMLNSVPSNVTDADRLSSHASSRSSGQIRTIFSSELNSTHGNVDIEKESQRAEPTPHDPLGSPR